MSDEGKRLAKLLRGAVQPTIAEIIESAKRLGAREDAEFWVDFFREWKSVEFDKEQRIVIEHSLEVAQKRLRELEELG